MKSIPLRTTKDLFARGILFLVLIVSVLGILLAVQAAIQSVRFARGTDQILDIVEASREEIKRVKNIPVGEDMLARLYNTQRFPGVSPNFKPARIMNGWDGILTVFLLAPKQIQIQTVVPPYVCRQMLDFLGKNIAPLSLLRIEARDADITVPRQIYQGTLATAPRSLSYSAIDAGCGQSAKAVVGLTFFLGEIPAKKVL